MGVANDQSSELERGSSLRASVRFSNIQGDDDDYDLQAMGIADGFRPLEPSHTHPTRSSTVTPQDVLMRQTPPPRPSSITKPRIRNESLSLQHDGLSNESDNDTTLHRVSTASTSSPFVDPEDAYEGPSGPSHPYQMYSQDVRVTRTASLATTSTAPVSERSYNGPRGPAHPYGMYPQNTLTEAGGMPNQTAQADINVGFPGTTDNYQRRIGPDGEDVADMIGPDGHTEQLPPYTRYPDETYNRKALGLDTPQPAAAPVQPMLAIPGAGGIGLATRNPEFASTDDLGGLNSPLSRQSVRSFTSEGSQRELTANSVPDSEVTNEKKSLKEWQVTAKRRVWGIVPCWAIVLAAVVLVLMGIILGAVIGTLANSHYKKGPPPDGPPSPATTSNSWDTQPLTTLPPDLSPLQEGTYSVFLTMTNNRMSNTCFRDSTLAQAWSCNFVSPISMEIKKLPNQPDISDYSFTFIYNESYTSKSNTYSYGVQPPDLSDLKLKLVSDIYQNTRGPAWNFEMAYNKTVILHENAIPISAASPSSTSQNRRRMFGGDNFDNFKRKGVAGSGDKLWICQWNNTIMETSIYANQSNSFSHPLGPVQVTSIPAMPTGGSSTGVPGAVPTSGISTGVESDGNARASQELSNNPRDYHEPTSASDDLTGTESVTSTAPPPSPSGGWPAFPLEPPAPPYPRVIKVEERRTPDSTKPVCRQFMVVSEDEEAVPVIGPNGEQIEVYIEEIEGPLGNSGDSKRIDIDHQLETLTSAKSTDTNECSCTWWVL
ncbi:hypothetical protein GGR54DRAFT_364823 [Hypoxylon sp. NC1633]|nr:hypothetical protein GGR54DRAFT_364823 [Hypoxylon sp. NC1633]